MASEPTIRAFSPRGVAPPVWHTRQACETVGLASLGPVLLAVAMSAQCHQQRNPRRTSARSRAIYGRLVETPGPYSQVYTSVSSNGQMQYRTRLRATSKTDEFLARGSQASRVVLALHIFSA